GRSTLYFIAGDFQAARDAGFAVGTERHGGDVVLRGRQSQGCDGFARGGVPQHGLAIFLVPAANQDHLALRAKGGGPNDAPLLPEPPQRIAATGPGGQLRRGDALLVGIMRGRLETAGQPEQAALRLALLALRQATIQSESGRQARRIQALLVAVGPCFFGLSRRAIALLLGLLPRRI